MDRGGHVWPKDRGTAAADGTELRFTVLGDAGPWVVLCAGFLCADNWWEWYAGRLAQDHRVLVTNIRGVGASGDPPASSADPWSISAFASDVRAMMRAAGASQALLVGHSMGCEVALEAWRQDRSAGTDGVAGLALVTGSYRSPLHDFYNTDLGARVFPRADRLLRRLPDALVGPVPRILALERLSMAVGRSIRALGPHTPFRGARGYFTHGQNMHGRAVMSIARAMHEFDAGPWLDEVDVPTIVVVAEHDTFTPPSLGPTMRDAIPGAELHLVRAGTHGALVEFPDELVDATLDWAHRHLAWPEPELRGHADVVVRVDA